MAIERKSTYILANHEGDEFEGSEPPWDQMYPSDSFFLFLSNGYSCLSGSLQKL